MSFIATASKVLLDTLLPPQCLACNALVDTPGALCASSRDQHAVYFIE